MILILEKTRVCVGYFKISAFTSIHAFIKIFKIAENMMHRSYLRKLNGRKCLNKISPGVTKVLRMARCEVVLNYFALIPPYGAWSRSTPKIVLRYLKS